MILKKIPLSFYQRTDVVQVSQELLGKYLFTQFDGELTGGMIVETEAYRGAEDRASHAYGMRRTKRTEIIFKEGGYAYVYLCYGLHSLLNIVTNVADVPHAVLIRAIEPTVGIETMLRRRKKSKCDYTLTAGPGALCQALGITVSHNGESMMGEQIWLEDHGVNLLPEKMITSTRVGVDYAGEDAKLPWRFRIKESPWTSRAKGMA